VGSEKYEYKLRWLEALRGYVAADYAPIRTSWCSATTTSPPRIATCTTEGLGGLGARERARRAALRALLAAGLETASGASSNPRNRSRVGLPDDGVPPQCRTAHRPDPGQRALAQNCGACHIDKAPLQAGTPSTTLRSWRGLTYRPPHRCCRISLLCFPRALTRLRFRRGRARAFTDNNDVMQYGAATTT